MTEERTIADRVRRTARAAHPPLVIAAHGTRDPEGAAAARELAALVRTALPEVTVDLGFVELTDPGIAEAVATAAAGAERGAVVVVPLMLGKGGHVRRDIPEAIEAGRARVPGSTVAYAPHLGPDPALRAITLERIRAVLGDWSEASTTVVLVGRGCSIAETNADHVALTRLVQEEGGFAQVLPAFLQVTGPDLPHALDQAARLGAERIVVAPNVLFPGAMRSWTRDQAAAWSEQHPDGPTVRVAEVIGPCAELAAVVVDRYRAGARRLGDRGATPVYLSGLVLRGRDVLVVGGGRVAERRIVALLDAGARVRVVSPTLTPVLAALEVSGRINWSARAYADGDVAEAWYILALTDDPAVNTRVAAEAETRHIFCVRGDHAAGGSAWTPATGRGAGMLLGVIGRRDPSRTAAVRDALVTAVRAFDDQD
ncbi:CbiX/SirB N-terminal domain-containing protein [Raineyella sp. LH-20]|uniref:CbiX/SirB N-terminal domain-containing protein n=1 Tax=Raineyella sp. LH-20 TaxID=3081204 RepID=UPI0029554095|nr:CbiX/SirB N-terminal domain-containing protein [Raineyella sp. LH-20]WOP19155.1 CbiX/SirB N-terminal domain-containing protein [Raineyella sp. LH-20]